MTGLNTKRKGDSLEEQILALFRAHTLYSAARQVRTPAGRGSSYSDLNVTYRQGDISYSILIECKNHARAIPKEIVFALSARRLAGRAQLAILITRNGLQSGASDILANYPRLAHFRVDEFRDAIQSGRLDDFLPRLASAQVGDSHELVEFNKVIEHFDVIARSMALVHNDHSLCLRAASQIIKGQYACLVKGTRKSRPRDRDFGRLLAYCSEDVRAFLSRQHQRQPKFVELWVEDSRRAAEFVRQEGEVFKGLTLPWQRSFYKMPFRALKIVQGILEADFTTCDLPEFEQGGLDDVPHVLALLERSQPLIAEVMFERMITPTSANVKTVIVHLGRRFRAFRKYVLHTRRLSWADASRLAVDSTIGTDLDKLEVRHNVAYCGAMFGNDTVMQEDIENIQLDPARMEALVDMNLRYGRHNLRRILAMLRRKSQQPPPEEAFVKPWAGVVYRRVLSAATKRHLL